MLTDVFDTLQVYLGSQYVNDFNLFGRTFQVIAQADARVPRRRRGHRAAQDAQHARRDGADRQRRRRQADLRPGPGDPLQRLSGGRPHGRANPALLSSTEAVAMVREFAAQMLPPGMELEWTGPHLRAGQPGQRRAVGVPALRAARVPRARGAVRELVAAARDDPDRADVPLFARSAASGSSTSCTGCGCGARRRATRRVPRQQHLHADRARGADRASPARTRS